MSGAELWAGAMQRLALVIDAERRRAEQAAALAALVKAVRS